MDRLAGYSSLSEAEKLSVLTSISNEVVANVQQKCIVLEDSDFLSILLCDLASGCDASIATHSLIILNSLLYMTERSISKLTKLGILDCLVQHALNQSQDWTPVALKNLSWNFKAFTKILYYSQNFVYTITDDLIALLISLIDFVPKKDLELENAYYMCLFNLFNLIPSLGTLTSNQKVLLTKPLRNKCIRLVKPILNVLQGELPHSLATHVTDDELISYYDSISTDFRNCYLVSTLPVGAPVELDVIHTCLAPLLYSFAFVLNLGYETLDKKSLPTDILDQGDSILPKHLYYAICALLNSESLHLRLGSLCVMHNYLFKYLPSLNSSEYNEQFTTKTVYKCLPYLMYLFNNNSLKFSNDIPIIKDHKPFNLLLGLCQYTNSHLRQNHILEVLSNYNVLQTICAQMSDLINEKLLKLYIKNCTGHERYLKNILYLINDTTYEDTKDKPFLLQYATMEDLEFLKGCLEILNSFTGSETASEYRMDVLAKLLNVDMKTQNMLDNQNLTRSQNRNANGKTDTKLFVNTINLITIASLTLHLKLKQKFCAKIRNANDKQDFEKFASYVHKNYSKSLIASEILQSILIFLKNLSRDVALVRTFFAIQFNKDQILKMMRLVLNTDLEFLKGSAQNPKSSNNVLLFHDKLVFVDRITVLNNYFKVMISFLNCQSFISLLFTNLCLPFSPLNEDFMSMGFFSQIQKSLRFSLNEQSQLKLSSKPEILKSEIFTSFILYNTNIEVASLKIPTFIFENTVTGETLETLEKIKPDDPTVLKINLESKIFSEAIYSFKLANLRALKNFLYKLRRPLKREMTKTFDFCELLFPLFIANTSQNNVYLSDYNTVVFTIIQNLILNDAKVLNQISNKLPFDEPFGSLLLDISERFLTFANVITQPSLVSSVIFTIVNLLALKESYRNLLVSKRSLLEKILLILDIKIPNISTNISNEANNIVIDKLSEYNWEAKVLEDNARKSEVRRQQEEDVDEEKEREKDKDEFSLKFESKGRFKKKLKEKYQEMNRKSADTSNNDCAESQGDESNELNTSTLNHNMPYINAKLACIWVIININWDSDKEEDGYSDTILDRWKVLEEFHTMERLYNYKNTNIVDIKQMVTKTLDNYNAIGQYV